MSRRAGVVAIAAQILFIFVSHGSLFGEQGLHKLPHREYALVCANTKEDHSAHLKLIVS